MSANVHGDLMPADAYGIETAMLCLFPLVTIDAEAEFPAHEFPAHAVMGCHGPVHHDVCSSNLWYDNILITLQLWLLSTLFVAAKSTSSTGQAQ